MKRKFTLALALVGSLNNLLAQDLPCFSENFSNATNGWTYSQGASIHSYTNPANNCSANRGIVTPGVGGNNPCQVKTPMLTSNGGAKVKMIFDMFVMDANLKCNTWKDFACTTSVDVRYYANGNTYQGAVDYILPPNGPGNSGNVVINFYVGPNLPAGTQYQIEMFFKFKSGVGNCVQQNTKYVFDNFNICNIQEVSEKGSSHAGTSPAIRNTPVNNATALVYPNPTMGATQLNIPGASTLKYILVSDVYGRIVLRQRPASIINISALKQGTYFVQLIKQDGTMVTDKLLVN